jgi:hypothetical protein
MEKPLKSDRRLQVRTAELKFRLCSVTNTKYHLEKPPHPFVRRRHNLPEPEYRSKAPTEKQRNPAHSAINIRFRSGKRLGLI